MNLPKEDDGRRLGLERRSFFYSEYIPERRSGKDRRQGQKYEQICIDIVLAEPLTM